MDGDITKYLPEQSKTVSAIYAHYKKTGDSEPTRGYLGASIIGHVCERYLWYCFRNCCKPEFSGRMYRLFKTGNLEEPRFVNDLRSIGCDVHETDTDGEQFSALALGGHFSGHLDGCALGIPEAPKTWHVLEFKTHSEKNYKKLVKLNVKEAYLRHYCQMMIYMHLTGMKRALYLAKNKNTDELHSERIRYDKTQAEGLMERAKRIITSTTPPEKISDRSDYYQCNWCSAKDICFGTLSPKPTLCVPELSCRQCCHATPSLEGYDGRWICEKHQRALVNQNDPCRDHLVLPGLLSLCQTSDYGIDKQGNDFINFKSDISGSWKHGRSKGAYGSEELIHIPISLLGNDMISLTKELFGAEVIGCTEDILDRYSHKYAEVWVGKIGGLIAAWHEIYDEHLPILPVINRSTLPTHSVVEYEGKRIAVIYPIEKKAEIRARK